MGAGVLSLDPGTWPEVVVKIGLGGTIALMLALGLAIGLATRGPEWIRAIGNVIDTIATAYRENKRINFEIGRNKQKLEKQIKDMKVNGAATEGNEK
jgi:hypothetical protein